MLAKPERLEALKKRLTKAAENIQKNVGDKVEKQKLLDLADKVRESAAKHTQRAVEERSKEMSDVELRLQNSIQAWATGTVLLGSGAEHLTAETKRALASLLIRLGSLVLDGWTRLQLEIDFSSLKSEVTSEDAIKAAAGKDASETRIKETERLISGVVDILEYAMLAEPIRRITHQLCEQARNRVLAVSVEAGEPQGIVERIIHSIWLADIDTQRGRDLLVGAIKDLPDAFFLRIALVTHFLVRVYWNHWKKEDRLALLDCAAQLLEPLNVQINKPELKRLIEQNTSPQDSTDGEPH
jgi:hypothetical protein